MPFSIALVTSSYRGDLERCRLLCDSVDRFVTGHAIHYILVEAADLAAFRVFEGPKRRVVCERDILPVWLRPIPDPLDRRRRLWLSPFGLPLRGWHVQQLRRIAMGAALAEDVLVSLDSDVVFVRPFDVGHFRQGEAVRFYRRAEGLAAVEPARRAEHERWARRAARLLGLAREPVPAATYITTLIAWRRDTVRDMLARIARTTHRPAMMALVSSRALSECTIYGRFVDEAEERPERHVATDERLCAVYWDGPPLDEAGLERFLTGLSREQVALGLQSFTGTDPAIIRRVVGI